MSNKVATNYQNSMLAIPFLLLGDAFQAKVKGVVWKIVLGAQPQMPLSLFMPWLLVEVFVFCHLPTFIRTDLQNWASKVRMIALQKTEVLR